jgi:hypothetical protein
MGLRQDRSRLNPQCVVGAPLTDGFGKGCLVVTGLRLSALRCAGLSDNRTRPTLRDRNICMTVSVCNELSEIISRTTSFYEVRTTRVQPKRTPYVDNVRSPFYSVATVGARRQSKNTAVPVNRDVSTGSAVLLEIPAAPNGFAAWLLAHLQARAFEMVREWQASTDGMPYSRGSLYVGMPDQQAPLPSMIVITSFVFQTEKPSHS